MGRERKKKKKKKQVRLPEDLREILQGRFQGFGTRGAAGASASSEAFKWVVEVLNDRIRLEDGHSHDLDPNLKSRVKDLQNEVERLKKEIQLLSSQSVEAVLRRNEDFSHAFGVSKPLFDRLLDVIRKDFSDENLSKIFTPGKQNAKASTKKLSLSVEDCVGVICRRICRAEEYGRIGNGLGKDESYVRKLFNRCIGVLSDPESNFSKTYLSPRHPDSVWKYCKEQRPDIVAFLEKNVANFDPEDTYYPVCLDGVHFESKRVFQFFTHMLSWSDKKTCCTVLSVMAGIHTGELAFFSELFGGKTSEPSIVKRCDIVQEICSFARSAGAKVVFFVDKGFTEVVRQVEDLAKDHNDVFVFMPIRQSGGCQLSKDQAEHVRDIAWIRQVVEFIFGDLKRTCKIIEKGRAVLGSKIEDYVAKAKRLWQLVCVCIGIINCKARLTKSLSPVHFKQSSILKSLEYKVNIPVGKAKASGRLLGHLGEILKLNQDVIEKFAKGHCRDREQGTHATNLISKGSSLVLSHHVLGCRIGRTVNNALLLVFVILASYRKGTYHVCFRLSADEILDHYCTCFVGTNKCIHQVAALFMLARLQLQPISQVRGSNGLSIISSLKLELVSRDEMRDNMTWMQVCDYFANSQIRLVLHEHVLNEKTFLALKNRCMKIRRFKMFQKRNRGNLTIGDELENMQVAPMVQYGVQVGVDWDFEERNATETGQAVTKRWRRDVVLRVLAESGHERAGEAKLQKDVLDICPCQRDQGEEYEGNLSEEDRKRRMKCPKCRQWWHEKCGGTDKKAFKECAECKDLEGEIQLEIEEGTLGFFENDFEDLHKASY